jgi:D-alanyl-lipoteichoic acid acyltransferase DltB (MBOAT superfamily)
MILNTPQFYIILLFAVILFYSINKKYQWIALITYSILFIGYLSPAFLLYSLVFSVANYIFGLLLIQSRKKTATQALFVLFLVIDIGQLVFFKYTNFLIESLNSVIGLLTSAQINKVSILAPLGISYYTFQSIGYLINVKRGTEKLEKHPGKFVLYNLFFPKFIAGPIERSNRFFPQIREGVQFDPATIRSGVLLIMWGFFKKFVIAERLAIIVNGLHSSVDDFSGSAFIIVFLLQPIHLYLDFSGYTHIALGIGRLFNLKLTDNFNRPFLAQNVSTFWRRWHISLSSWCNDYIFNHIILKRRRWGKLAAAYAVTVTFLIIGIWHGPNWNFVILGLLQVIALNYEFFTRRSRIKLFEKVNSSMVSWFSRAIVYLFFSLTLVFFYSMDVPGSIHFITELFNWENFSLRGHNFGLIRSEFLLIFLSILLVAVYEILAENGIDIQKTIINQKRLIRWSFYYAALFFLVYFAAQDSNTFIYAQF